MPQLRAEIKNIQDTQIAQASIIDGVKDFKKFFNRAIMALVFTAVMGVVSQNMIGSNTSIDKEDIKKIVQETLKASK